MRTKEVVTSSMDKFSVLKELKNQLIHNNELLNRFLNLVNPDQDFVDIKDGDQLEAQHQSSGVDISATNTTKDRIYSVVMMVMFFFGLSTNTVVISKSEDTEEVTLHICSSFLSVLKNESITGKFPKSFFYSFRMDLSCLKSDKGCATIITEWLGVSDLSSVDVTKVSVSFEFFLEKCKTLFPLYHSDIISGMRLFKSLPRNWLDGMDQRRLTYKLSDDRVPFKGTRMANEVGPCLPLGLVDCKTYSILQDHKWFHIDNGFLEYFENGCTASTSEPHHRPVLVGSLVRFDGFWHFYEALNGVSSNKKKRKIEEENEEEEEEPKKKAKKAKQEKKQSKKDSKKRSRKEIKSKKKAKKSHKKSKEVTRLPSFDEDEENEEKEKKSKKKAKKSNKESKEVTRLPSFDEDEATDYGSLSE